MASATTRWLAATAPTRFVAATIERFGGVDAVFANAGFGAKRGFLEETPEQWRAMVLTNVLGVAYSIRAALPHFRERNGGHFLLTSSVAGRRALPGSLYSSTKWAVTGMGDLPIEGCSGSAPSSRCGREWTPSGPQRGRPYGR